MHTTALADEAIGRLYEGDALALALRDARERTLAIYSHLDLEGEPFPKLAIVNPAVWELSHIAWFQEYWCLRHPSGAPSMLEDADRLFDSTRVPHDTRWSLPYPPLRLLLDYMRSTLEASVERLAKTPESQRYFFALALLHEDMHGEALLMTLQTLGLPAPPALDLDLPRVPDGPARDVAFGADEFEMGTARDERGFVFDNEKWAHPVRICAFRMADRPVTQGEYAAFLEATGAPAPKHWRRDGSSWRARRFDRWEPIDARAPMIHVTLDEARAFCGWAGRRLPTEAEWEYAAAHGGSALRQMIGGVWEWTSSPFAPYPGFRPDPYKEYSEPWFGDHYVLRGGSFATRARLVHSRFRNFYLPQRSDAFAGLRTCAV